MNLIERVKAILLNPNVEWPVIADEPGDAAGLLVNYVAILAFIPALAGFIGGSLIGVTTPLLLVRVPISSGLFGAAVDYLIAFVVVYIVAFIIDVMAGRFGGRRDFASALKLSVYSFTPFWIAGIFLLIPGLRFLTILGLYGLYLLWTGVPPLMRAPRDQALGYAATVVGCTLIIHLVIAIARRMV